MSKATDVINSLYRLYLRELEAMCVRETFTRYLLETFPNITKAEIAGHWERFRRLHVEGD